MGSPLPRLAAATLLLAGTAVRECRRPATALRTNGTGAVVGAGGTLLTVALPLVLAPAEARTDA